jgi:hypothetical protein
VALSSLTRALAQIGGAELAHPRPAVGQGRDQPFAFQDPDRLPERRPAHAKHGDHVALADALAGFQPSGDDGISQSVHHPVADQLRLEEPDGRRRLGCRLLPL